MHPYRHALDRPDRIAVMMSDGSDALTYAALDRQSNRAAHLFRRLGLRDGDVVALLLDNRTALFEAAWGAQRAGLYMVGVSTRLTPAEIAYILRDSGARLLLTSPALAATATALRDQLDGTVALYATGGAIDGYDDWNAAIAREAGTPIADERAGIDMLYSSGTTGTPKGVRPPLPADRAIDAETPLGPFGRRLGMGPDTVYLCPAPLYHAAPLRWCMTVHRLGGTVVVMDRFDAETALALIERHRVTHSQWVPTHFVRMLKLPDAVRLRHDLSSHQVAIHAAAPCPVPVKQAMIDWWGPILVEYYAGTEFNGLTTIDSAEWATHVGSVGRALVGIPRICDDEGRTLPTRQEGIVFFEGGPAFAYHNDPEKTAAAHNAHGWSTMGDIGWLDEEGYLYLTDRKSFTIISGGVNVYPQEIENLLVTHPAVMDAAVFGVPDEDLGEAVMAVVQPAGSGATDGDLPAKLRTWLRERLSSLKVPKRIELVAELPRQPTGKLHKRQLRDQYAGALRTHAA